MENRANQYRLVFGEDESNQVLEDPKFNQAFEEAAWLKEKARERLEIERLPANTITDRLAKKECLKAHDLEVAEHEAKPKIVPVCDIDIISKKAPPIASLSIAQGSPVDSGPGIDQGAKEEHVYQQPTHPGFAYSNDVQMLQGTHPTSPELPGRQEEQPKLSVETADPYISGAELIIDAIMGDFLKIERAPRPSWKNLKRWIKLVKLPPSEIVFMEGGPNKKFRLHRDALPSLKGKYRKYYEKQAKNKK